MAFKIATTPRFTHDVPIRVPVDDGHEDQTIRTTYEVIDDDEFASFETHTAEGLKNLCRRIVLRMDGIEGEDGRPAAYDDALRDRLLELPYVRLGIMRGYQNAMIGAKTGN